MNKEKTPEHKAQTMAYLESLLREMNAMGPLIHATLQFHNQFTQYENHIDMKVPTPFIREDGVTVELLNVMYEGFVYDEHHDRFFWVVSYVDEADKRFYARAALGNLEKPDLIPFKWRKNSTKRSFLSSMVQFYHGSILHTQRRKLFMPTLDAW